MRKGVMVGDVDVVPTGTLAILDTAASASTATWIGHDGSGTYSGAHLSALTTTLNVVAGLTQSTADLQTWKNASGTNLSRVISDGTFLLPAGATGAVSVGLGAVGTGFWSNSAANIDLSFSGANRWRFETTQLTCFNTSCNLNFNNDASLSRISAAIVGVGTGAAGSVAGQIAATKMLAAGTAPTLGGACTTAAVGTLTDESGKISTTTTGVCTFTITFGTAYTTDAPSCSVQNNTTANLFVPSTSTTVLTGVGTTVSGDVISYSCRGHKP